MTTQTNILTKPWVVAKEEDEVRPLTGKDYPELCDKCRAAIDQAACLIAMTEPWGTWYSPDDPENACNYAYDHGWLCGGHEAACVVEPEPEWTCWISVLETRFASGLVVLEETGNILPIDGNNHCLWSIARDVASAIDPKRHVLQNCITAVVNHDDGTWTEIELEIQFGEVARYQELLEMQEKGDLS